MDWGRSRKSWGECVKQELAINRDVETFQLDLGAPPKNVNKIWEVCETNYTPSFAAGLMETLFEHMQRLHKRLNSEVLELAKTQIARKKVFIFTVLSVVCNIL